MATVINILSQQTTGGNIQEHVIVRLNNPSSSIRSRRNETKSGLIRISSAQRLKKFDKILRKDLKYWMPSLSKIHVTRSNIEQEHTEITEHQYNDAAECVQFIQSCGNKCVILILSDSHAQNKEIISIFKKLPQISALYCYKTAESLNALRKNWLIEGQSFLRDVLPRNVMETKAKDLDKQNQLLLAQIFLSEIIVNLSREDNAKKDFITYCHSTYRNDPAYPSFREKIEHFDNTYREEDVIEWYTDPESFVFRIVSKTCANFDLVILLEIRLILRDLYVRLQQLHQQQLENLLQQGITVYRGKMMSTNELNGIRFNQGLFITRNFLSTSTNKDVAFMHAGEGAITAEEVSVLISMKIDRTEMQDKPIAYIGDHSQTGSESEVMLSMGLVFRIDSIEEKCSESRHWVVMNMIRGEDEKQIEKNLSRFHLLAETGATCAILGIIPFLTSIGNEQHIEKYSQLISNDHIQSALTQNNVVNQNTNNISLNVSQGNVPNVSPNEVETNWTEQVITHGTMNTHHIGSAIATIGPLQISHIPLVVVAIITVTIVSTIVIPLAIVLQTHSATKNCQPIVCSAISSVLNPSPNYQVEHLDFHCLESLSNMTIIQTVQRTLNETHAQQYQTFWNYSTNMTYFVTPTQLIYEWYSLPGMLIVKESFPHFVEAQYYYTPNSTRNTSVDTWQIWLQSVCGDTMYLNGTY